MFREGRRTRIVLCLVHLVLTWNDTGRKPCPIWRMRSLGHRSQVLLLPPPPPCLGPYT